MVGFAAFMVVLVFLCAVLTGVQSWLADRQTVAMREMAAVIRQLHTVCPWCGGRPHEVTVISGRPVPPSWEDPAPTQEFRLELTA